ncbi:serpin-ZXA-like [Nymphaea colorata]|nr:serpin-ZXA-like [Nymphaea colorata]XP_031482399.1 serpin-ZXA-like [Nymphaea colorata]
MDLRDSIQRQTESSLLLASHIAISEAREVNFVFSPLTVHIALSMVAAGSTGRTNDQILSFLRATTNEELNSLSAKIVSLILADGSTLGGPTLYSANGIWVDESMPLKPAFAEIVKDVYEAEAKAVDFQTKPTEVKNEVNLWAEGQTNGLIKELLPSGSVDNSTRLILASALYFKGAWKDEFDASVTEEGSFYPLSGESVQVMFMTSSKEQFIAAFPGFKVLKLPYGQGEDKRLFSMYFFLPDERNGLHNLVEKIGSELDFINRHLPSNQVSVGQFMIPKFKISHDFEASEVLKQMGLFLPFSEQAELTEMVDLPLGNKLFVSGVFHKSFIEVNEEGTEAASATGAVVSTRSAPRPPVDFVADHPFLFLIREELTGVLLFVGHVLNPLLPA